MRRHVTGGTGTPPRGHRSMIVVAVALALGLLGATEAVGAEASVGGAEARVIELMNAHRAAHGLGALTADAGLQAVARRHAERMAGSGALAHNTRLEVEAGPAVPTWSRLGENVASGGDADAVVAGILGSGSHHANVDGPYDLVGIGGALGPDGTLFITQVFALSTPPGPSAGGPLTVSAVPLAPAAVKAAPKPAPKPKPTRPKARKARPNKAGAKP